MKSSRLTGGPTALQFQESEFAAPNYVAQGRGSREATRREIGQALVATRKGITILLPALNEEAAIGLVLEELPLDLLVSEGYAPKVLIVDGHSTDRTVEVAARHGMDVVLQSGIGKGWAVRTGLLLAETEYVVMLDADYTYPPAVIPMLLRKLEGGADIAVGSRLQGGIESEAMRGLNVLGNRLLSLLASLIFGHHVTDVCSGMWAFGPEALRQLDLNSNGFEVEAEIFAKAVRSGLRVEEIPIVYRPRVGRRRATGVKDGLAIAAKLVRKRFTPYERKSHEGRQPTRGQAHDFLEE